jgi:hypothetical protein
MRVVVGRLRGGDGVHGRGSPGSDRARLCERLGAPSVTAVAVGVASAVEGRRQVRLKQR